MKTYNFVARSFARIASVALVLSSAACAIEEYDADLSESEVSEEDAIVTAKITHVGTMSVYDSNGQGLKIDRPSGSVPGDLLILALHRTDDHLPLVVAGWTRAAECLKRDNGYDCSEAADCQKWNTTNNKFCDDFGSGGGARDLAQAIFYRKVGSTEAGSYTFNMNVDASGHPGWAILTALRGADTTSPVRGWANKGCDNKSGSAFPSVSGVAGDMLLLSQSFDDSMSESRFLAPPGATKFGYTVGNDETGFLFGKLLTATGQTGVLTTQGSGSSSQGQWCKDALVSLVIKPKAL
jgi:hypothetical protein